MAMGRVVLRVVDYAVISALVQRHAARPNISHVQCFVEQ
jgi:hypothetical protein